MTTPTSPIAAPEAGAAFTDDRLLGGRVRLRQPQAGYRAAIDPVFLAAAVPACASDHVLDLGTGAGAAALCLAVRTGCAVTGLEIDPAMAALARANAVANEIGGRFTIIEGDVNVPGADLAGFSHAMANPPFRDSGQGSPSPNAGKRGATVSGAAGLQPWVDLAVRAVRPGGTVTFVYRADRLPELLAMMPIVAGDVVALPLWPRAGADAGRVLVQARVGGKGPFRLSAGLVVHDPNGPYTREAEAVLRGGAAMDLSRA